MNNFGLAVGNAGVGGGCSTKPIGNVGGCGQGQGVCMYVCIRSAMCIAAQSHGGECSS